MRIIFAGTPDFAASHLQALLDTEHDIVAVYTQPDRPAGRGKKLMASAVKSLAIAHNIAVLQPETLKTEQAQHDLTDINADIMVVVAYGIILPKAILSAPRYGCINVHGSILPKWRGAAPIQRALWAGDKETGVTIMQMDEGLDTGDILEIASIPIQQDDTSASLYTKLAELGPKALVATLSKLDSIQAQAQNNDQATYAAKLSKQEACLDWTMPAQQLERNVRAFNPWPVAWFLYAGGPIKVWQATIEENVSNKSNTYSTGQILSFDKNGLKISVRQGIFVITKLQISGKKPQEVAQMVNGQATFFTVGTILE